jgi:hypothetical protein
MGKQDRSKWVNKSQGEVVIMRSWRERFELLAMAVTYAESGERETAIRFLGEMKEEERIEEKVRDYSRQQVVNRKREYKM